MSTPRRQRGPVAWLAIVALWLTIVAPVVSQTLAMPSGSMDGMAACADHHPAGKQMPPSGHPLDKCGYCGLLAGHSLLPDVALPLLPAPALDRHPTVPSAPAHREADRLLAAEPRGPPAFANR